MLPDGTVLAVQCSSIPDAQKYVIATNSWVSAGVIPVILPKAPQPIYVPEMGPQVLLPDGRVFAIGATGHTALYTPPTTTPTDPGTWAAGPDFPADANGNLKSALDAPACLLPNGNVLCCVGPIALAGGDAGFSTPSEFYEFDPPAGILIAAPAPAIAGISPTYNCRLLVLPTGQVMLSACSDGGANFDLQIYTPAGGPQPAWRPRITHVPRHLHPGRSYRLHGKQLNGLSQACAYGDDQQMATNYPLVRLWGHAGAFYCRTYNHSTMGVATGDTIHHTHFEVPHHVPYDEYRLVVIANGIASHPTEVRVERRRDRDRDEHDEEMEVFEHEETKYKDKDAKEAKEKEKDAKDTKEKETKECKDKEKDCKDVEHKYCKEIEHKNWKEKEHKEFEGKGCKEKDCKEHKEKDCPEHMPPCPPREDLHDREELLHRIDHLVDRIERIEHRIAGRAFIGRDERPDLGGQAVQSAHDERHQDEHDPPHRMGGYNRHEDHGERDGDRAAEERRHAEEERRRHEEERRGAAARMTPAGRPAERKAPRPGAPKKR